MSFLGIDFKIAITYPHYLVPHTFWVVNTSVQYWGVPCWFSSFHLVLDQDPHLLQRAQAGCVSELKRKRKTFTVLGNEQFLARGTAKFSTSYARHTGPPGYSVPLLWCAKHLKKCWCLSITHAGKTFDTKVV